MVVIANVGEHKNVPVAAFGGGRILMLQGEMGETKCICLFNQTKKPLGDLPKEYGEQFVNKRPDMVISFENLGSLLVVMESLELIKADFEKNKPPSTAD